MGFAFNDVVVSGKNPRDSLEVAVEAINKKIEKKQQEFALKQNKSVQ